MDILSINQELPKDVQVATKLLVETFLTKLYPFLQKLGSNILTFLRNDECRENVNSIHNMFTLCVSQINKCYLSLIDILKLEHQKQLILLESRQCTLERLSWCCSRLGDIEQKLQGINNKDGYKSCLDESIFNTPLYFVNWIDQTFDVLKTLNDLVTNVGGKDSEDLYDQWKNEMAECLSSLHTSIDELLVSAMTLCRYCLPVDQHVIKARCQVVLRETKALLSEVFDGDIDTIFDDSLLPLKLPIKPSNVNVLIDVLRDALYVLETNTNTALLALLVHCFSYSTSPVEVLKSHYEGYNKGTCKCLLKSEDEITNTCHSVKEFDLHNERLLQIGSFAVSCSSDEKRILALRSSLATLEALDPHLVPALIMAPESDHSTLLKNTWNKEVSEIKDSVFLIVDPAAFSEKARQMMHKKLLDVIKDNVYDNSKICYIINIGCVVHDFFDVYNKYEPDAINERDILLPLLADLNKVQSECKVVSDVLSSGDDFVYNLKKSNSIKNLSLSQMFKRLKLLYTLVNKIKKILHPNDNEDFFENDEEPVTGDDVNTYTVNKRNETCVNSPRRGPNFMSRSIFARSNIRSPVTKLPLSKLTKHLKQTKVLKSNFSAHLDELCNMSDFKLTSNRDSLTFFYSPMRKRPSLRKAVLNKHQLTKTDVSVDPINIYEESSRVDESLDLQITEVLKQINDLTVTFSTRPYKDCNRTSANLFNRTKQVCDTSNTSNMDSNASLLVSNISQPSNVTTLERLNDLDLVESKLSDLRVMQLETSL